MAAGSVSQPNMAGVPVVGREKSWTPAKKRES